MRNIQFRIDLVSEIYANKACMQYDDLKLEIEIYSGGVKYNLADTKVTLNWLKADNTPLSIEASTQDNIAIAELDRDFTDVPGMIKMELEIEKEGQATSFELELYVNKKLFNSEKVNTAILKLIETIKIDDAISSFLDNIKAEVNSLKQKVANIIDTQKIVNMQSLGVVPNSSEVQNEKINEILASGGKHYYLAAGNYLIDDSIVLHDNTIFELDPAAVIEFKANTITDDTRISPQSHDARHIFKNDLTTGTKNIEIFGGKIFGNARTQAKDCHRCFKFTNVKNLKIHDMTIEEVGGWIFQYLNIDGFHFYNLHFKQAPESIIGYNGDGISGVGKNGVIENIYGYVSDDLVSTHAGETGFAGNYDCENILIRNVYPEPLIWEDDNGIEQTEYCYRAFAIYSFNNRQNRNVTIDGVYGISKCAPRVVCDGNSTTPHLVGVEVKNVDVEVKDLEVTNVYEKTALTLRQARADKLVLDNVNLTYSGINQLYAIYSRYSNIKNLQINNCSFKSLGGNSPFVIQDGGTIENLQIKNTEMTATKDTIAFYKSSCSTSTTLNATNVIGTLSKLYKEDDALISYLKSKSTPTWLGSEGPLILSASTTITGKSKIINVNANNVKITLKDNIKEDGYVFLLNIYNFTGTELYEEDTKLFPTVTLNMGLYIIGVNKDTWNIAKISDNKLGDTV